MIIDDLIQTGGTLKECGKVGLTKDTIKDFTYESHPINSWIFLIM